MKRILILLLLPAFLPAFHYAQTNYGFAVQTTVKNGIIEGNYDTKEGLQVYLGVPFAKPPVGP
ncbi:MAG: carboxylesterase family protein, partial [Chitinophagaceae bacterium]